MKVFVHTTYNHREYLKRLYARIVEVLKDSGVMVITNHDSEGMGNLTKSDVERMSEKGENVLDKMDGIVIDASVQDPEVGYLLAYAIAQKKPILYLYEKHSGAKSVMGYLTNSQIPDSVTIKVYEEADLPVIISDFLHRIETGEQKDVPSIKFTLRITPQIERFLTLKAKQYRTTKADYMRDKIIKKYMEGESNKPLNPNT